MKTHLLVLVGLIQGTAGFDEAHERALRSTPGTMLVRMSTPCSEIATRAALAVLEGSAVETIASLEIDGVGEVDSISIFSNCAEHLNFEGDMRIALLTVTLPSSAGEAGAMAAAEGLTAGGDGGPVSLGDGFDVATVLIFVNGMVHAYPDWGADGMQAREAGSNEAAAAAAAGEPKKGKHTKKEKKSKKSKGKSKLPKQHVRSEEISQRRSGFQRHKTQDVVSLTSEQWSLLAVAMLGTLIAGAVVKVARDNASLQALRDSVAAVAEHKPSGTTKPGEKLSPVRNRGNGKIGVAGRMKPPSILEFKLLDSAQQAAELRSSPKKMGEEAPLLIGPTPLLA